MKQQINKICELQKELDNYTDLIFEKENEILSCIKSVNQGELSLELRQKRAASALLSLKQQCEAKKQKITSLLKSCDLKSFSKKQMTSELIFKCITEGVNKEELSVLKKAYKSI